MIFEVLTPSADVIQADIFTAQNFTRNVTLVLQTSLKFESKESTSR